MHHLIEVDGVLHRVWLARNNGGYRLYFRESSWPIALEPGKNGEATLMFADEREEVVVALDGNRVFVQIDGMSRELLLRDPVSYHAMEAGGAGEDTICAPMPGSVIAVSVAVGDSVSVGDTLMVIESMKLEMALKSPRDGIVETILYSLGQTFERDAVLAVVSPHEG
jgi:biotin carboxyl carrier protein